MVGLYDDPDALIRAAEKVRDAGYRKWDCHTPYPVHGLDEAMGLKDRPCRISRSTAGFVGVGVGLAMTGGLSVWQYPIRIGGKALFSWQAFVPIYFELFVLLAALATMGSDAAVVPAGPVAFAAARLGGHAGGDHRAVRHRAGRCG